MDIVEYQTDLLKVRFFRSQGRFIEHPDCFELIATNGDRCFIDLENADLCQYSWNSVNGYFTRATSRSHPVYPSRTLFLHCLVLERKIGRLLGQGEHGDHINWDKSNNRKVNLRVATKPENAFNARKHRDSSNKFKGVSRSASRYRVQFRYSIDISQTGFETEVEAARFYDDLAAKHHGKFAAFNFPNEWVWSLEDQAWNRIEPVKQIA